MQARLPTRNSRPHPRCAPPGCAGSSACPAPQATSRSSAYAVVSRAHARCARQIQRTRTARTPGLHARHTCTHAHAARQGRSTQSGTHAHPHSSGCFARPALALAVAAQLPCVRRVRLASAGLNFDTSIVGKFVSSHQSHRSPSDRMEIRPVGHRPRFVRRGKVAKGNRRTHPFHSQL